MTTEAERLARLCKRAGCDCAEEDVMGDATPEDLSDFDRAVEILSKFFLVVSVYSPDDEVLAMHWAVSEEALDASVAEMLEAADTPSPTDENEGESG